MEITKAGNRSVVFSTSILLAKGEEGWVEFDFGAWRVKAKLHFTQNDADINDRSISISTEKDYAIITFTNWDKPVGTSTRQPIHFANRTDGEKLWLMTCVHVIGDARLVYLQFSQGGES